MRVDHLLKTVRDVPVSTAARPASWERRTPTALWEMIVAERCCQWRDLVKCQASTLTRQNAGINTHIQSDMRSRAITELEAGAGDNPSQHATIVT